MTPSGLSGDARRMLVGVISDTHGLLRPQALTALERADLIVHAGDVGTPEIIGELRAIAPVHAVRGNVDTQPWAARLPETLALTAGWARIFVLHEIAQSAIDPASAGYAAVIFGHSHRPSIETRQGVLYLNPGSAGPRRFNLPVTVATIHVSDRSLEPELVMLDV